MGVLKTFNEPNIIEEYIQEISELKIPVEVVTNAGIDFKKCNLIYRPDKGKDLFIQAKGGGYPDIGEVSLSFTHSKTLCTFNSRIISLEEIDSKNTCLKIEFPKKITKEERREYFRIKPPDESPIRIQFILPDDRVVNTEVIDISGGGISFVIANTINRFNKGDLLYLDIILQNFGKIHLSAEIKSITYLLNMIRIGSEFVDIPEAARTAIVQYVITRETEIRKESDEAADLKKAKICLINNSHHQQQQQEEEKYNFLDCIFNVIRLDFFNVISKLTSHMPELIVLQYGIPESLALFEVIKKHRLFRYVPLILLTGEEKETGDNIPENTVFLSLPLREKLFIKTAEGMIEKYRFSKKIESRQSIIISSKMKKILIVDRFSNFGIRNIEALTNNGFEVNVYDNEKNLSTRIDKDCPCIILIDEETDKIDPVSLCRLMNMNKKIKAIPKIILTSEEQYFEKFYSQGFFSDFLVKPVHTKQLIAKILKAISNRNDN